MTKEIPNKINVEPGAFQKLIGYEITDWGPGYVVIELELEDRHLNRHGSPHGGVLMTLLDAACTRSGTVNPKTGEISRASTVSVSTNFICIAKDGLIRVEGRKTGGGRRLFFAEAHAFDVEGSLVASAVGTCRYAKGTTKTKTGEFF